MVKRKFSYMDFWNTWGIYLIILLAVIIILVFWKISNSIEATPFFVEHNYLLTNSLKEKQLHSSNKKIRTESAGEKECKRVAEKLFNAPFSKIRPNFLNNEVTGNNLELDLYNESLKIAIEYNGKQHYVYTPYFHKSYDSFLNQKYRDKMKSDKCKDLGISLIIVPYTVKISDIEGYIQNEARRMNLL